MLTVYQEPDIIIMVLWLFSWIPKYISFYAVMIITYPQNSMYLYMQVAMPMAIIA